MCISSFHQKKLQRILLKKKKKPLYIRCFNNRLLIYKIDQIRIILTKNIKIQKLIWKQLLICYSDTLTNIKN